MEFPLIFQEIWGSLRLWTVVSWSSDGVRRCSWALNMSPWANWNARIDLKWKYSFIWTWKYLRVFFHTKSLNVRVWEDELSVGSLELSADMVRIEWSEEHDLEICFKTKRYFFEELRMLQHGAMSFRPLDFSQISRSFERPSSRAWFRDLRADHPLKTFLATNLYFIEIERSRLLGQINQWDWN